MYPPGGTYVKHYREDIAIIRTRSQWILLFGLIILLLAFPAFADRYILNLMILISTTLIAVLGLNILTGYSGQISIGHAAFLSVGAFTSAILILDLNFPFWISLPCAGLAAAVIGLFFGLPSLRLKGFYLAMATLAAQFIIDFSILHTPSLTGGNWGLILPPPKLGGLVFDSVQSFYFLTIIVAIVMTFFAKNLVRTRAGRAFIAIRDNDKSAEVMGVDLFHYKLLAFFIASFYAGIAGALWGQYMGAVTYHQFTLMDSIWYLGMLIVGGMGSIAGAAFGTISLTLLKEFLTVMSSHIGNLIPSLGTDIWAASVYMALGLVIILFLIFEPRGMAHRWEIFKSYYRLWPFSY